MKQKTEPTIITFFMAMDPPTITHQQHKVRIRNGKAMFYEPEKLKAARSKLMGHLAKHRPEHPIMGPIELITKWCFPANEKHRPDTWRITKPDTDNLQKLLKDCMTDCGFWKDDAQVCSEHVDKFWSKVPGIFLKVTCL